MAYSFTDDLPSGPVAEAGKIKFETRINRPTGLKPVTRVSGRYRRWGKRLTDILIVLAVAPFVLLVLLVAGFVTAMDGGNAFYAQNRIGRDGRVFKCWKIRSMVPNAEAVLRRMISDDSDVAREWRENQKLTRDPRVTRWGRVLRRTSIDELPQLWNVLKGEMSMVGPRPFTPEQKALYDGCGQSAAYYRLRPGITGLWQVDCRNDGAFDSRLEYDMRYEATMSLSTDLAILWRTIFVVLRATGK